MKFCIVVGEGPGQRQSADSAYHFVRAALAGGHEVVRVFFYHDGVHAGARRSAPPQDERNLPERWSALAREHGLDLVVCVAAARRRGLSGEPDDTAPGHDTGDLADGFRAAGLGQLVTGGLEADRLLVF